MRCLLIIAFTLAIGFTTFAEAHELLPKEIVQFIKENPEASPEELRDFASSLDSSVAQNVTDSSAEELLAVIQNPDSGFFDNMWDFFKLGVEHLLRGPDHILFVLSLLLVFVSVWHVVKLSSTFTIAHSITIILAGTGILILSPSIVEPLIALSIVVMAFVSVFFGHIKFIQSEWSKIAVIFFFGLFHGLGFAGLLQDVAIPDNMFIISLLAFNIGIEVGQLFIIVLALPVILFFKDKEWYPQAVRTMALIISFIALVWFVQRILGL